jgi:hypothetical protein
LAGEHLREDLSMKRVSVLDSTIAVGLVLTMAWVSRAPVAAQEKPAQPLHKWQYKQVTSLRPVSARWKLG